MFTGFKEGTIQYFNLLKFNNNMQFFNENRALYDENIKKPMTLLHEELTAVLMMIDDNLSFKLQKCISSPFSDLRFNKDTPLKGYFYVRFKLMRERKTDIPGFFFDASDGGARFGVKIYDVTPSGMAKIREVLLNDFSKSEQIIGKIHDDETFIFENKPYKKDHFPQINEPLKKWLNSRDIHISRHIKSAEVFFTHKLAEKIIEAFNQLQDVYKLIKKALDNAY